ncbi:MAG: 2-phosphosulfolactate phosphatase [Gaiellales bacterium]
MAVVDVAIHPDVPAPADVVVVVDTVRATTTIAHALAGGYRRVVCVPDPTAARAAAARIGPGAVLAGEDKGARIEGFELGNSPTEFSPARGDDVVFVTRNGVQAILAASREADVVVCGALVNLDAVARAVGPRLDQGASLVVRCAGTRGAVAVEDCYTAGRLVELVGVGHDLLDGARVARAVARAYAAPIDCLAEAQSTRNITPLGHGPDVAIAAQGGILDLVPTVVEAADDRVVLTAG